MNRILTVELPGNNDTCVTATLPLTTYEMLDVLDKLRMTPQDEPEWEICEYHAHRGLHDCIDDGSFYELNAFCTKLSELDKRQSAAFDGLVEMEKDKGTGIIPIHRLLDLAYSTEQCHVLDEVHTSEQLGKFYAANGFVPEAEGLSDEVYKLLDFRGIGEKFQTSEDGVFTRDGYVVQDGNLAQDVWKTLELPVKKPEYTVLLRLDVMDTDCTTLLKLPASPTEMDAALDRIGESTWSGVSVRCVDCRVPALRDMITLSANAAHANRAAECLASLPEEQLPKYKALLGALEVTDLQEAVDLTQKLDEYILAPEQSSYEDVARGELHAILGEKEAETLLPHVNLYQYGRALQEKYQITLTEYGSVERQDNKPLMESAEQRKQQTTQGAMAMEQQI